MNLADTALKAAQGSDTEQFLDHIAWTDVICPKLLERRDILTKELVDSVLNATSSSNKEQVAGCIHGIDFAIRTIEALVREGRNASATLRSHNISLK